MEDLFRPKTNITNDELFNDSLQLLVVKFMIMNLFLKQKLSLVMQ